MWAIVAGVFVLWGISKVLQSAAGPYTPMSSDSIEEMKKRGAFVDDREWRYRELEKAQEEKLKEWLK
jgi:hypothetical protein